MKKGIVIFSLFVFCSLGYSINIGGMVKGKIDSAVNDAVDGAVTKQLYSLSNVKVKISSDGTRVEVTGVLKNKGPKTNFASISFPCYDKNGTKVGDTIAIVNNGLEAKESWNFSSGLGTSKSQIIAKCDINKAKVSGF